MVGIRKKITVGFLSLAVLLFFSGMVSLIELNRLSRNTTTLLDKSQQNMEIAKQMLDAVQDQNTSLLQMIVRSETSYDSLYLSEVNAFDLALQQATLITNDQSDLSEIYEARKAYNQIIETHLSFVDEDNIEWFVDMYKTSYYNLTSAIKNYMVSSQENLASRAELVESSAYRAITPGILALAVGIIILLMFLFFIDIYLLSPVVSIQKSLKNYITTKIPFNVKMEGKDEVFELKEDIEELISMHKNRRS